MSRYDHKIETSLEGIENRIELFTKLRFIPGEAAEPKRIITTFKGRIVFNIKRMLISK